MGLMSPNSEVRKFLEYPRVEPIRIDMPRGAFSAFQKIPHRISAVTPWNSHTLDANPQNPECGLGMGQSLCGILNPEKELVLPLGPRQKRVNHASMPHVSRSHIPLVPASLRLATVGLHVFVHQALCRGANVFPTSKHHPNRKLTLKQQQNKKQEQKQA